VVDANPTGSTRRALRTLATPTGVDADGDTPVATVDEATAALESVERATRFLATDGVHRLTHAVVESVRDGDAATVRRGREALATLRAFQSALDGGDRQRPAHRRRRTTGQPDRGETGPGGETRERVGPDGTTRGTDQEGSVTDHFHPARGTVLGRGGERGEQMRRGDR
jgi:hypothetical protein